MVFILDAAALLNNESFSFTGKKGGYFTTSLVFSEWRDFRSRGLAESAASCGLLSIVDPCPLSVEKANSLCDLSGTVLGDADVSIVALALEMEGRGKKPVVVTDDYSVQNVLKRAKIRFIGVAQAPIKKSIDFSKHKQS